MADQNLGRSSLDRDKGEPPASRFSLIASWLSPAGAAAMPLTEEGDEEWALVVERALAVIARKSSGP